jgi:hypothetical protein
MAMNETRMRKRVIGDALRVDLREEVSGPSGR